MVGSQCVGDIHLAQAFGKGIDVGGGFIILCGFLGFIALFLALMGSQRHNKVVLLVYTALDLCLVIIQLCVGADFLQKSVSDYDASFQLDCVLREPELHSVDDCAVYIQSERYARMLLVWYSYTYLSLDKVSYFQRVTKIQTDGLCCGFGPPLRCVNDDRLLPKSHTRSQVVWDDQTRYECGAEEGWYGVDYFCEQLVDETAVFPVVGGCRYDRPMGDCMGIMPSPDTRGCAAEMDARMTRDLAAKGAGIVIVSMIIPLMVFTACCLFGKRSHVDVLPDHIAEESPFAKYAGKSKTSVGVLLDVIYGVPAGSRKHAELPEDGVD